MSGARITILVAGDDSNCLAKLIDPLQAEQFGVTARNGIFSTLRPFVGDLTKRKRARIRLQLVSAQIWVLTTFSFQDIRLV